MKARVKATGEIIEVERVGVCSDIWALQSDSTVTFEDDELDINIEPDYWEKLKHQYAGMAIQGILANPETIGLDDIDVAATAIRIANITVTKLKEESQ